MALIRIGFGRTVIVALAVLVVWTTEARAMDLLGLKGSSTILAGSVERTMGELDKLLAKGDKAAAERIEQVNAIVERVIGASRAGAANIKAIVDEAIAKMEQIEASTMKHAVELIYRAQCVAEVALADQLQRTIQTSIETILRNTPTVKFLGIEIIRAPDLRVRIVDPDQAYRTTKKYYLEKLLELKPGDDAYLILSHYQNISRFAGFARCHYIDQGLGQIFVAERAEFERLSRPWLQVVTP